MNLDAICRALRESRGFAHKSDISDIVGALDRHNSGGASAITQTVAVGDDCAAIPDGNGGYLLFAIEGFVDDFVAHMPWFAGYCGVMVNVSDIYAMGGRPVAVVDALWSQGMDPADEVLRGMAAASERYAVPIVGGHSNNRSLRGQLAVAILGRARKLLTSFAAQPGDDLVMAVDLRGGWQEPYPYWNASTGAPGSRLRADLELLPMIAEDGLCDAAKDISMAGALGTALMLLECSQVGARIALDAMPRPSEIKDDAQFMRWLSAFPSFGFMLSVRPHQTQRVLERFRTRSIDCAVIGRVTRGSEVRLSHAGESHDALLWDFVEKPFITAQSKSVEVAHA